MKITKVFFYEKYENKNKTFQSFFACILNFFFARLNCHLSDFNSQNCCLAENFAPLCKYFLSTHFYFIVF